MKIYLDTCCWGRWQDEQSQAQIIAETQAIEGIFGICRSAGHIIIGSPVVTAELMDNPDEEERDADMVRYGQIVKGTAKLSAEGIARARAFRAAGLGRMDSRHLAVAEADGVEVLLTVDNQFLRVGGDRKLCSVRVLSPTTFLLEVINGYSG